MQLTLENKVYNSKVKFSSKDLQESEQKKQEFLQLSKEDQKKEIDKLVNELFPRIA